MQKKRGINITRTGKVFNLLIEDNDLLAEDKIGKESHRDDFIAIKRQKKIVEIREIYRRFRSCLKIEAKETRLKLRDGQEILQPNKYEVNNIY